MGLCGRYTGVPLLGCWGKAGWGGRWADPGETPPHPGLRCGQRERLEAWRGADGGGMGTQGTPPAGWGPSTGTWPQFRTIREKEVTILNSKQCEEFYHRFSKIPSLVRIINSQMICARDQDRKDFCYVSTCPCPPARGQDSGGRGRGKQGDPALQVLGQDVGGREGGSGQGDGEERWDGGERWRSGGECRVGRRQRRGSRQGEDGGLTPESRERHLCGEASWVPMPSPGQGGGGDLCKAPAGLRLRGPLSLGPRLASLTSCPPPPPPTTSRRRSAGSPSSVRCRTRGSWWA